MTIKKLTIIFFSIIILFLFLFILPVLPFTQKIHASTTTDGLVGYWKMDETTGGSTVTDSSGDGNNGTPNGTGGANNKPQPNTDVASGFAFANARSLDFDGTDDYVQTASSILKTADNFTISAWFKSDNTVRRHLIWQGAAASNGWGNGTCGTGTEAEMHISMSSLDATGSIVDNQLSFWMGRSSHTGATCPGTISLATPFTDTSNWYFVTVVASNLSTSPSAELFLNGVSVGTDTGTTAEIDRTNWDTNLRFGRPGAATRFFDGKLDDVRIYNRALSATEITALAAGTHTSAAWTGASSTAWETAGNWDIGAVPDNYTNITIANVANAPILGANIQTTNLTINSSSTLDLSSYTLQFNDSGTFTNNGTLKLQGGNTLTNFTNDTDSGTVEYSGAGTYSSLVAGNTYNNLIFSGSGGSWTLGSALDVNALLTLTAGTLDVSSTVYGITVGGGWTDTGAGSFTERTGTVTFDGTGTINSNETFNNVIVNGSGITATVSTNSLQVGGTLQATLGILDMNGIGATITGLTTVNGGTLQASTATQTYNGGLTVSSGTFTGSSGTVDVNGVLTLSGGTFTAPSSSGSLLLSGNLAISGSPTFTHNSGTFTFDAGSGTQTLNSGGVSFNNISHSGAGTLQTITNPITIGGTFTNSLGTYDANGLATTVTGLATVSGGIYTAGTATQKFDGGLTVSGGTFTGSSGTVDVNGALTVSSGVFTAPSSSGTFTVSGNFDHSGGTFTHNSGTITLDGTNQTISGSSTVNNFNKTVTSAYTLTFTAGATQTIVGTMTLKGASGNLLSLRSSSAGTQWRIDPQGARSIQYLDLKDSYNINATAITTADLNITDSGNNTGWTFNTAPSAPSSLGSSSLTNGSWTTDNTPTFTLTLSDPDASQTVLFRIQIDNNSDFSSVTVDYSSALQAQGSTSFTVGQSAGSGTYTTGSNGQTLGDSSGYYWRVRTEDAIGTTSDYTTANSGGIAFKVDATNPSAVSLNAPDDKSYTTEERPTFRFKLASSPDATSGIDK